ncbi:LysM peptidoglycan-binding domain-containing protein [Planktotalea sp.]|uniref:LysM peptidoglycan-binding domain-containing protein n=1 Tax=Planktotalea sp. TaxID=2029877 RepID=UPI00329A4034
MSKLAFLSSGSGIAASGGVVIGVVALVAYSSGVFDPKAPLETPVAVVAQDSAEPTIEDLLPNSKDDVVVAEPETQAPSFDVVRVETSGAAMIAGSAEAGSSVAIRVDNEVIAEVKADSSGKFASFVDLPKSADAQVLTLDTDGGEASEEQVIVMPSAEVAEPEVAPVEIAETQEKVETVETVETAEVVEAVENVEIAEDTTTTVEPVEIVVEEVVARIEASEEEVTSAAEVALETSEDVVDVIADAGASVVETVKEEVAEASASVVENATESVAAVVNSIATIETTQDTTTTEDVIALADVGDVEPVVEAVQAPVEPESVVAAPEAAPEVEAAAQEVVAAIQPEPSVEPIEPVAEPVAKVEPVVETPAAPTVLIASEDGVRVLQSANAPKPEALTSLLGAISYDDSGDVALTGSAGGEFVRVYLDNRPIAVSQIAANGDWQAGLPSVDTGVYTLRVDELNEAGDVVARVETPFKREAPEVLAAATSQEKPLQAITVQPGATLWAIARDRYGSGTLFARVFEANSDTIKDPNLIYPGQVFKIPD